ncbi:MAG: ATP-binding protein, partial [Eubacteriaceae bacterium]|nr:ATP-binding protein [Eubacteriaceae bacterium]
MGIIDDAKSGFLADAAERKLSFERTKEETIRSCPSLLEINRRIFGICASQMRGELTGGEAEKLLAQAEAEFGSEAERLGVSALVGEYVPLCGECGDTGFVNGKQCRCLTRHIIDKCYSEGYSAEYRVHPGPESFDTRAYSTAESRKLAERCRNQMLRYIDEFEKDPANLAIIGVPGSGKTLMARIICGELIKRGHTVMCLAAYRIVEIYSEEMFDDEPGGLMEMAENCDLLVIDDLGTERQTDFTENLMFQLIDTRFRNGLPTIITTNLSPDKQRKSYNDRVFS